MMGLSNVHSKRGSKFSETTLKIMMLPCIKGLIFVCRFQDGRLDVCLNFIWLTSYIITATSRFTSQLTMVFLKFHMIVDCVLRMNYLVVVSMLILKFATSLSTSKFSHYFVYVVCRLSSSKKNGSSASFSRSVVACMCNEIYFCM